MPKPRIILAAEDFPIKPDDILTTDHFWDAFSNTETEVSARYIVQLMQSKGDWVPFTQAEIDRFYFDNKGGFNGFSFNRLLGSFREFNSGNWSTYRLEVIEFFDGLYYVTDEFILRCYRSSPAIREKPTLQRA